jgi:hypothetical protein
MSIPLDRLYHFIDNIASNIYGECVVIYRFWPHGSKNINNLNNLYPLESEWYTKVTSPSIWCHDQEPLDHEFYKLNLRPYFPNKINDLLTSLGLYTAPKNLNYVTGFFEKGLLLHSEKRSTNLEKYQLNNQLIPVYYWSHGLIAQDWFRYAKHEEFKKNIKKTFLIYNRAWTGTREYRLKFSDLLIQRELTEHCHTNCNPIDTDNHGIHYSDYIFKNPQWRPVHVLENFLQATVADSNSSADFDKADYNSTEIEVVLETLFDDDRLHLTEKSIRPIACAQPFILAGTHGSLEYLRGYGFQTFEHIWDESYDQIIDPVDRLTAVVDLMQQIVAWDNLTRKNKLAEAQKIADYNRAWFFSEDFFNLITNELKTNLELAFKELELCNNYQSWIDQWQHRMSYPEINEYLSAEKHSYFPTIDTVNQAIAIAQNCLKNSTKS